MENDKIKFIILLALLLIAIIAIIVLSIKNIQYRKQIKLYENINWSESEQVPHTIEKFE